MAGEHQVFICIAAMGNVLQGLLNAETARIGQAASAVGFAIHPTRKGALAKATNAISLILPDQRPLFLRDKDKQIGSTSGRERVCQYVLISWVAGTLTKKT